MKEVIQNNIDEKENSTFLQLEIAQAECKQITINNCELVKSGENNSINNKTSEIENKKWKKIKFVLNTVGILISFSLYGIIQENITKSEYKNTENESIKEYFKYAQG